MEKKQTAQGHIMALFCVLLWGTTFISTKVLLRAFTPLEILFFRFIIGFAMLFVLCPKRMKGTTRKMELLMVGAGLSGVTLYFLFENIALTYTAASNVGVLVAIAPFLTALFAHWFLKEEKPGPYFYLGFAAAICGIALISFNGAAVLKLNPLGDLLAILAALVWGVYSILVKKISRYGQNTLLTTRRIFFYGILFMLPALPFMPFRLGLERFAQPINLFNILFLGIGASALCFAVWNWALKVLGAVKVSVYIYLVPVVTVLTSVLVLGEKITPMAAAGTALALLGLFLSEAGKREKPKPKQENEDRQLPEGG